MIERFPGILTEFNRIFVLVPQESLEVWEGAEERGKYTTHIYNSVGVKDRQEGVKTTGIAKGIARYRSGCLRLRTPRACGNKGSVRGFKLGRSNATHHRIPRR